MIPLVDKIDALVVGITRDQIERIPPAHRQRLAQALRHVADLCDPPIKATGTARTQVASAAD